MSKTISILGATGSIGRQTLDVAEQLGLRVAALTAHMDVERLEAQVRKFRPRLAVLTDEAAARDLAVRLADMDTKVLGGPEALLEAAVCPEADTVVTAVVGMVGLRPTLAAIRERKRIALANKETLVGAGRLVMDAADTHGAGIVPVDSEPFYGMTYEEVGKMTKADALRHPNWTMGPKITVDCATLMNKGLEVIEAMRLYRLPLDQVSVVIHRQSIVHSLVEYRDGAVLAQLGTPDMRLPIRYAMTYPERVESPAEPLDLLSCPPLTFAQPDRDAFPCLQLAEAAAAQGGTACAVLNGANEEAVGLFLAGRIGFHDIPRLVAEARAAVPAEQEPALEDILAADQAARQAVLDRA